MPRRWSVELTATLDDCSNRYTQLPQDQPSVGQTCGLCTTTSRAKWLQTCQLITCSWLWSTLKGKEVQFVVRNGYSKLHCCSWKIQPKMMQLTYMIWWMELRDNEATCNGGLPSELCNTMKQATELQRTLLQLEDSTENDATYIGSGGWN